MLPSVPDEIIHWLRALRSFVLLEHIANADYYLAVCVVILTTLAFAQVRAFARPPPVPLKRLPRRPALNLSFKPDDISSRAWQRGKGGGGGGGGGGKLGGGGGGGGVVGRRAAATANRSPLWRERLQSSLHSVTEVFSYKGGSGSLDLDAHAADEEDDEDHDHNHVVVETVMDEDDYDDDDDDNDNDNNPIVLQSTLPRQTQHADSHEEPSDMEEDDHHAALPHNKFETPFLPNNDLPDSFAPLLSSSQLEILKHQLTADLLHAVHVKASLRFRPGRHEIPLDKDNQRPQLILDVPASSDGCRISATALVGSDGFSLRQDLDASVPTSSRSKPMVKHAAIILDPPLPLVNVAPTLVHFPTLFQDNTVPHLRRIQIVRYFIDLVMSFSSFLEKCLWLLESQCQIHLGKVKVTPRYKGSFNDGTPVPQWRLSLAFSGHVLLFGWIPIPFISVVLPTFIIPQPHALLDKLLTAEPLATAKLRRENIAEERIALAALGPVSKWHAEASVVVTPPAVGVDVTLPGGVAVAMEMQMGRDPGAGKSRTERKQQQQQGGGGGGGGTAPSPHHDNDAGVADASLPSTSSWTTRPLDTPGSAANNNNNKGPRSRRRARGGGGGGGSVTTTPPYDANQVVPWLLDFKARGSVSHSKMSFHLLKFAAKHDNPTDPSKFSTSGSFAIWKVAADAAGDGGGGMTHTDNMSPPTAPKRHRRLAAPSSSRRNHRKTASRGHHPALDSTEDDSPSVAAILLFPDETTSFHRDLRLLQYDYAFDVSDDTHVDAVTISVGATHPMLKGGTMVTTILDSMFAFGTIAARENAVLDPMERHRKRNILRHLPAIDFTCGVQNVYIPAESCSYSDDGQTLFLPALDGGRLMVRFLGGLYAAEAETATRSSDTTPPPMETNLEGIKVVANFEIPSLHVKSEGGVKEFPELNIFDGVKFRSSLSGIMGGSVHAHLRPQKLVNSLTTTGPNVLNPLEAYEVEFSNSNLTVKMKEYSLALGHRRVIFPPECTFSVNVTSSIVDMGFEGTTQCELSWDFQGLSPILQVTTLGQLPEKATPESKQQVSLLIAPLRQGRISFHVSSVGGIQVEKAATLRADKEGLYDWKFFNALVSPDNSSAQRIIDVLHDKRTMDKLLQVSQLINEDLHKILRFGLRQFWRAKQILDEEGVKEPGDAIPMRKMARLVCLLITDDVKEIDRILPIVKRVISGEGLDVVKVKELLRDYLPQFDEWAPEIDRVIRWGEVFMGPLAVSPPFVEENVRPLVEMPSHAARFEDIPYASQLYDTIRDKPHLPLEQHFSQMVSRVAPYLSFEQVGFLLEARSTSDWQHHDLRRLRYVYSIKKKVLEIAESYGGLSFLPQSFLVSVFLGEATRASMRASGLRQRGGKKPRETSRQSRRPKGKNMDRPLLSQLRDHRHPNLSSFGRDDDDEIEFSPAERVASFPHLMNENGPGVPANVLVDGESGPSHTFVENYELGDSLLGPQDVAILLQSGLTSVLKTSSVVQLNQRMLLDLISSQPRSFAVAVLAEIGEQGNPRSLTSALMALLELDQTAFKANHQIDMHALLESWLPGLKIPRRDDYLAGGRWARQSYYEAVFSVAASILDDAETYMALKQHIQRVRCHTESDPIPHPKEEPDVYVGYEFDDHPDEKFRSTSGILQYVQAAKSAIALADEAGRSIMQNLIDNEKAAKQTADYQTAIELYQKAFDACAKVLSLDKHSFHAAWFRDFYKRNYDSLMIKSMYDNVMDDTDKVRHWLFAIHNGALEKDRRNQKSSKMERFEESPPDLKLSNSGEWESLGSLGIDYTGKNLLFLEPEKSTEQALIDAILHAIIFEEADRKRMSEDPLVRLLISNPPGHYDFAIVSAMGVITDGKRGVELKDAFARLEALRGVKAIRADTGTARSMEYNANKIEEAIKTAVKMKKPYGLLGYSQGCANALMAESILLSGSPKQQEALSGLVGRQLIFSAANGSFHGPSVEKKIQRVIVMCEEFFKYQQGYVSRAFVSTVLETLNTMLDSAAFHKLMGGAQSFMVEGCRAFWREAQHLGHIPTCTLRGAMETHTTPESLEMISHLLTKQSGSPLHDSQVHVFDAVGYPVYHKNRNGRLLERCAVGDGAIQRTHHWSPLSDEVEFVETPKDHDLGSFECAKDRHVFPWVDVNARFGFIKYVESSNVEGDSSTALRKEIHPIRLISAANEAS